MIGAVNAVSAADMALAGVVGHIPADEVIDAMAEVGAAMSRDLRETGIGGLAGTPDRAGYPRHRDDGGGRVTQEFRV